MYTNPVADKHFCVFLYIRYQYDPSVKIQQAMASIWAALVPESKKTVSIYGNHMRHGATPRSVS